MTNTDLKDLKQILSTPKNIVIVPHKNPDGDAMGASLAMKLFLEKKNHTIDIVTPNDYPDFLKWLPKANTSYKFDMQNRQSKRAINNADLIFLLDFNALHRVGDDMANTLKKYEGTFVMIDHHQQPDDITRFIYSDTEMCSTCQMVYHFIEMFGEKDLLDKDIATCIYTGIMTDTGSFRFRSTTSTTHRVVADLIDLGADNARIHNNVYDTNSYSRMQLLGVALNNMKMISDYKTAYITLSQDEKEQFDFKKGDTEGFVNYALSLKGIVLAVIFIEDKEQGIIKMSLRSKGSFSVNEFARSYFDGGGHTNAAGGRSTLNMEETVEKFINLLPNHKEEISKSYEE
ncbi:DHH family phosphoesterase [Aureivirga sp. CE67]|uniref:DHH family phosphoesterase n=1 Tax=Aureivirga sp. CE67 TaxID=1788983 RepID=UPI0018C8F961|nr:bifunctional oligoribonuclease/PAP phosphatase NrnA [Aureivirga sp. CE67]